MDTFPRFLASVFVIVMAAYIGVSLVICGVSVVSAKTFHNSVADFIGSVDESDEEIVIDECEALAKNNGYTLKTEKCVTSENRYYYDLTLEYALGVPFFGKIIDAEVGGSVYPQIHYSSPDTP